MCRNPEDDGSKPSRTTQSKHDDPFPWHLPIYDAHCHPTDTMSSIPLISSQMRASALTVMATRSQDQQLVADVASNYSIKSKQDLSNKTRGDGSTLIIPSFGWHPWFSHHILDDSSTSDPSKEVTAETKATHYRSVLTPNPDDAFINSLPTPTPLSSLLSSTTTYLTSHPHALIGEIGLDKAFRLPAAPSSSDPPRDESLTPGGREGRFLSPYRVKPEHQRSILEAQLRLAGEQGRAVSVHGVQAHGLLLETVAKCWKGHEKEVMTRRKKKLVAQGAEDFSESDDEDTIATDFSSKPSPKPYPPRICLHSFSAPPSVLKQWLNPAIPASIFFSFSVAVNAGSDNAREKLREVIKDVPERRLLVESDLHKAGSDMEEALEDMYRFVCEVKGWTLEEGVKKVARNYEEFILG